MGNFLVPVVMIFSAAAAAQDNGDAESGAAAPDEPAAVIERLHGALIENMVGADELGYDGREAALTPVVSESFNAPYMMRAATGRFWRDFSDEQKHELIDAFVSMTIATYASQFAEFSGQSFETLETREIKPGQFLVKTHLNKADGGTVSFDYRLREGRNGWQILDIFLDGTASQLAVYRSEYTSVLERDGYSGLLRTLNEKAERMRSEG